MILYSRGDDMGSAVMHLCIGKKVAQKLNNSDRKEFLIGNLAPDLSKITNQSRYISHFLKKVNVNGVEREVPDIESFISEYKERLNEPFIQGYLCHLISDDIWFKNYIPNHVVAITEDKSQILLRDIDDYIPYRNFKDMMYRDYTRTNQYLFDLYKLNLKKFDNMDIDNPNVKEFEFEEIHRLIEQISYFLEYTSSSIEGASLDTEDEESVEVSDLELLSTTEIVTYIEEAINQVVHDYIDLQLIK